MRICSSWIPISTQRLWRDSFAFTFSLDIEDLLDLGMRLLWGVVRGVVGVRLLLWSRLRAARRHPEGWAGDGGLVAESVVILVLKMHLLEVRRMLWMNSMLRMVDLSMRLRWLLLLR